MRRLHPPGGVRRLPGFWRCQCLRGLQGGAEAAMTRLFVLPAAQAVRKDLVWKARIAGNAAIKRSWRDR